MSLPLQRRDGRTADNRQFHGNVLETGMTGRAFLKMHGAGNDFVVLDLRDGAPAPDAAAAAEIADRHRGVGCDQVVLITASPSGLADAGLVFLNADGSESGACGNGTRCVARLLMEETGHDDYSLETLHGVLDCSRDATGRITVDMGLAKLDWRDIPLSEARNTLHLGIGEGPLQDPVGVSMGNPHAVFFVDDADAVPVDVLGPVPGASSLVPATRQHRRRGRPRPRAPAPAGVGARRGPDPCLRFRRLRRRRRGRSPGADGPESHG